MANSVDPDQTAPIGAVCSESMLFASIHNLSGMLGNYLQQTTSADDIFRCIFFLALLTVKPGIILLGYKQSRPRSDSAESVSEQGFYCLLKEISILMKSVLHILA